MQRGSQSHPVPHCSTQRTDELFLICVEIFAAVVHGDYHPQALVHEHPRL